MLQRIRAWNALGAAVAFGLIGYALYAQHFQGYEPCLLCVFQRIAMIVLGCVFLVAAVHGSSGLAGRAYGVMGAVTALVGAGVSGRHLYLQSVPKSDVTAACGPSGLDGVLYMVDVFGTGDALRKIFYPTGNCADVDWTFLGLSMPGWVLLWFVALGALALIVNWGRRKAA